MTVQVTFRPGTQIIDPKSGLLTRDGNQIIAAILSFYQGTQSAAVTTDGVQTLSHKTISGTNNTLENIPTSALATRTGNIGRIVTGDAGNAGDLAQWDGAGNIGDGPNLNNYAPRSFTANGAVATSVTSLGPTGSHTTVQEWLTVVGSDGVTLRYIPAF